jgi:ABC-type polysaccharide/polyol phosphate transport system ATPase subunit
MQKKDLIKKIHGLGAKMYRKGEIRRSESLSQSSFEGALRVFQESDILLLNEIGEKGDKKFVQTYALADDRSAIEALRRRLFKFL